MLICTYWSWLMWTYYLLIEDSEEEASTEAYFVLLEVESGRIIEFDDYIFESDKKSSDGKAWWDNED